jgi:hypothetical protein
MSHDLNAPGIDKYHSVLNSLQKNKEITAAGKAWLLKALDPFHDYDLKTAGYPDAQGGLSVVSMRVSSTTITKPAAAAANWDCIVASLPINVYSSGAWASADVNNASSIDIETTPTQGMTVGSLQINSADAGQPLFPNAGPAAWAPTNFAYTFLKTQNNINNSLLPGRVIAWGFEVHNTTSELYRQGTVTVGVMPQAVRRGMRYFHDDDGALADQWYPTVEASLPPATLADAMTYPNARAWEAKDGVYCAITQNGVENPVVPNSGAITLFFSASNRASGYALAEEPPADYQAYNTQPIPYNTHFAYFTGLSNQTSLTVTQRVWLEEFPKHGDGLLPQSTPSASYDLNALKLYGAVINHIPCGVPVGENGIGEFFRKVASIISRVAPALGMALSPVLGPEMGLIGSTIGQVAGGVEKLIPEGKKREKRKRNVTQRIITRK